MKSLALFVGTGDCNGNCAHCAGVIHRKYAPSKDGIVDEGLIRRVMYQCYDKGARSLSLTSSGEPTLSPLSVTKVLGMVDEFRKDGRVYHPVNLYSNGIRIGEDKEFSDKYLILWKSLGLSRVYITVHDVDEEKNARAYGVPEYPSLALVSSRLHEAGLLMRANLVLRRDTIGSLEKFVSIIEGLKVIGADSVSAWPVRGDDDKVDTRLAPPENELNRISAWVEENRGKGLLIRVLREKDRTQYQTGEKLTLFPDGTLSGSWCS